MASYNEDYINIDQVIKQLAYLKSGVHEKKELSNLEIMMKLKNNVVYMMMVLSLTCLFYIITDI